MKPVFAFVASVIFVVFASLGDAYAFDDTAQKYFDNGQYEECIQRIESLPDFKKNISNVMLLSYSNYQLYIFTKQKHYDNEYEVYNDLLLAKAGVDDLNSILFFVNSSDKPTVVKAARKLLRDMFEGLNKIEDVVKLVPFTQSSDKDVREYAFDSIRRIMEPIRDVVSSGGTMRPIDLKIFQNKDVINAAVSNLDISSAGEVLVLIQDPALEILSASKGNKESNEIIEEINREIASRIKDYPSSSWYSATGKQVK